MKSSARLQDLKIDASLQKEIIELVSQLDKIKYLKSYRNVGKGHRRGALPSIRNAITLGSSLAII